MSRFQPGTSGNPKGRPTGIPNRTSEIRALLQRHGPVVIEQVVAAAMKGDMAACRLILDRICAPLRAVDCPIAPVATEGNGSLAVRSKAVVDAALNGTISPAQAAELSAALSAAARVVQIDELEARLAALERRYEIATEQARKNGHWR